MPAGRQRYKGSRRKTKDRKTEEFQHRGTENTEKKKEKKNFNLSIRDTEKKNSRKRHINDFRFHISDKEEKEGKKTCRRDASGTREPAGRQRYKRAGETPAVHPYFKGRRSDS